MVQVQITVSVKAGNFDCVDIKCDANFTLNEAIRTANGTVFTTMAGEISDENKIDLRSGFLVKLTYDINKNGVFYRETPMQHQCIIKQYVNYQRKGSRML